MAISNFCEEREKSLPVERLGAAGDGDKTKNPGVGLPASDLRGEETPCARQAAGEIQAAPWLFMRLLKE